MIDATQFSYADLGVGIAAIATVTVIVRSFLQHLQDKDEKFVKTINDRDDKFVKAISDKDMAFSQTINNYLVESTKMSVALAEAHGKVDDIVRQMMDKLKSN